MEAQAPRTAPFCLRRVHSCMDARRLIVMALTGAALLVGSAGTASAAEVLTSTRYDVFDGPSLAGPGVAWQDTRCDPALYPCPALPDVEDETAPTRETLRLATPGKRLRILHERLAGGDTGGPGGGNVRTSFAVSRTRLALLHSGYFYDEFTGESITLRLAAGSLRSSPALVYRCQARQSDDAETALTQFPNFVLGGDVLAYQPNPCRDTLPRVTVRDLKTGVQRTISVRPATDRVGPFRLAGRYLAVRHYPEAASASRAAAVTVYEHDTGDVVYDAAPPPGRSISLMDVQSDGTIFVVTSPDRADYGCSNLRLGWYSSADPTFHPLPGRPCGGLIRAGANRVVYPTGRFAPKALRAVTVTGTTTTVASFGRVESTFAFDADARRAVFGVRRCDQGFDIVSVRHGDGSYRAGRTGCPVKLMTPLRLRAEGDGSKSA